MLDDFSKNVAISSISRVLTIGMAVLTSVIIARILGPSGKGILAALGAMVGIALQFGSLGLHGANTYFAAKDKNKSTSLIANSFWFSLVVGLVIFFISYLFLSQHLGALGQVDFRLATIALAAVPFLLLNYLWQNILVGLNKIKTYNVVLILNQSLYLVGAIVILLVLRKGVLPLVIFNTVTAIIITFLFWIYFLRAKKFSFKVDWHLIKQSLNYGFKVYISCFLGYLVLRSDIFILNYFRGAAETGLYSVAASFIDAFLVLPSIIALLLIPKATENLGQSGDIVAKVSRISIIIVAVICFGAIFLGRPAINIVFGSAFDKSFIPLLILVPGAFFLSIGTIISQYFTAHNRLMPIVYVWAIATILNISMNIVYIPIYGMVAAAASSLLAYIVVCSYVVYSFLRLNNYSFAKLIPTRKDIKIIYNKLDIIKHLKIHE